MPDPHPFLVHLPIALLPLATVLEILAAVRRKPELGRAGWWAQLLGTLGIAAAVISGLAAEQRAGVVTESALESIAAHSQMAFLAAALWTTLLLWRFARRTEMPRPRLLYLVLMAVASAVLLEVGFLGGELVFLHGIGVAR